MKEKKNKIQKRSVEIIEFEDGTFNIDDSDWSLDKLKSEELTEAFTHWKNNNIEVYPNKNKIPKLIKDNNN